MSKFVFRTARTSGILSNIKAVVVQKVGWKKNRLRN